MKDEIELRPAAAVLLSRENRVWLGRRGNTRFLPGFSVFPGGACDAGESHVEAALRELREETGLELPRNARLAPFARAITPAYSNFRYDVRVFRCEPAAELEPVPDGAEFEGGEWMTVSEILARRASGDLQLAPPTYRQLLEWNRCQEGLTDWPTEQSAFLDPPHRNEQFLPFAPGITVVPLRTRAIPPAAWTNALILGERNLYVVDPGGPDIDHLREELTRRTAQGAEVKAVILSHHHPDHTEGYLPLGLRDLPLYCHPVTAPLLPEEFGPTRALNEGDVITIEEGLDLVVHFTPGHAPGHLAFHLPQRSTVLAGDMISSLSSIVIPSDNGNLPQYLDSLERLDALGANLVIPSHGPPFGSGSTPFRHAVHHRRHRESQVVRVLSKGDKTLDEITEKLYRGLCQKLYPAARANVLHHLWKLRSEGRVREDKERWILTSGNGSS